MRKRSSRVALCLLGASAFALAGCIEETVDASAFPDLAACKAAAGAVGATFTAAQCDTAFAEAQLTHTQSAPRYDSLAVCEAQHGEGACGSEEQATGSTGMGGIFMPLLAGYLIGNMLGRGGAAAQPLYRSGAGGFTNADGTASYASNTGRGKLGAAQFNRPATTIGKPPMSAATVQSRGGFGSSAASRSAGG